jgi:hypothetical protein
VTATAGAEGGAARAAFGRGFGFCFGALTTTSGS